MSSPTKISDGFRLGDYEVHPLRSLLTKDGVERRVEPKVMAVLEELATAGGQVVSREQLMDGVWRGVVVSDETVTRCISELRQALADSSTKPNYIQTVPRKGYRLLQLPAALSATTSSESTADTSSIAVLPFVTNGPTETMYFADGMHDEVLSTLANISSLKVISRTSVQRYRDTVANMKEIGRELGVKHILEGRVQRSGEMLRINVQLINCVTDGHVWAQTYERALTATNVFEIQSEMAQTIARQLSRNILPEEQQRIDRRPTANLAALDNYIRGRQRHETASFTALEEALSLYLKAVEQDSNYADAHFAVANLYVDMANTGLISIKDMVERGKPFVQRGTELDPDNGYGIALVAEYEAQAGNPVQDSVYRRALELSPNSVPVLAAHASHLYQSERYAEGLRQVERALLIDPLSPKLVYNQGGLEMRLGHFDRALLAYEKIAKLDPESPFAVQGFGMATLGAGQLAEAAHWADRACESDPLDFETPCTSVIVYDSLGNKTLAQQRLDEALALNDKAPLPLAMQVYLSTVEGDHNAALKIARASLANQLEDRWRSHQFCLRAVRDEALRTGDYAEALAWYHQLLPETTTNIPNLSKFNAPKLADYVYLLKVSGDRVRAGALAEHLLEKLPALLGPGVNNFPMGIPDVDVLLALDRNIDATNALRDHVESGWRVAWRWATEANPAHDVLRKDQAYLAILKTIRADLRNQVAKFNDEH